MESGICKNRKKRKLITKRSFTDRTETLLAFVTTFFSTAIKKHQKPSWCSGCYKINSTEFRTFKT